MKKFICLLTILILNLSSLSGAVKIPTLIEFDKGKISGFSQGRSEVVNFKNTKCLSTNKEYKLCDMILQLDSKAITVSCVATAGKVGVGRLGAIIYLRNKQKKWKKVKTLGWNRKLSTNTFKNVKFEFTPTQKGLYLLILFRSNRKGAVILKQVELSYSDKIQNTYKINKVSKTQIIVIPTKPDKKIKRAAMELQKYIDMITGFAPRIVNSTKAVHYPKMKRIYVGVNSKIKTILDLKKCGKDGAWIKRDEQGNIFIAGQTSQGTEFGVYTFLQDYCGVRWYLPGDNGTYVPKQNQLILPEKLNRLSVPRFISRMFSAPTFWNLNLLGEAAREMDMQWLRHNRLANNIMITHAFYKILPPKKYFATHPEYFPMKDGKRSAPMRPNAQGWQPCMSNPEVVRICRDAAVKYFDKNPDEIIFSLGPNDGNGYCLCEKCQKLNGKPFINKQGFNSRARQLFSFMNKVAESMPEKYKDKYLGTLAYHWTRNPGDFKIHPQVAPILCTNVDGNFSKTNRQDLQLIKKLAANSKLVGLWAYLYGHNYAIPAFWPEIIENYIDSLSPLNVKTWYSETYQAWGRDGFKYYILAQKLWNPAVRSNKLIEEFCTNMFDAGAPEIMQFFKLCAERWNHQPGIIGPYTSVAGGAQFIVFPPEICDELIRLLKKAKLKCLNPKGKFLCDKFLMNIAVTSAISKLMKYELEIADAGVTKTPDIEVLFKAIKQLKMFYKSNSSLNKDDFARIRGAAVLPRGGISFKVENIAAPILDSFYQFKLENLATQFFQRVKEKYPEFYDVLETAYKARFYLQNEPELIKNANFKLLSAGREKASGWIAGSWATKRAVSKSCIISGKGKGEGNVYYFAGIKNCLQYMPRPCLSLEQNIKIKGSAQYMLSIRAKFKCSKDKESYLIPWVCIWFYDKNGKRIRKRQQYIGVLPGKKWFKSSWIIETPYTAHSMMVFFLATEGVGEAWVGEISLKNIKDN